MREAFNSTILNVNTNSNHKVLKLAYNGIKGWKSGELDSMVKDAS